MCSITKMNRIEPNKTGGNSKGGVSLFAVLCLAVSFLFLAVAAAWAGFTADFASGGAVYDGGSSDRAYGIAIDTASQNIYVVGQSSAGISNYDIVVLKYDFSGVLVSSAVFNAGNGSGNDGTSDLAWAAALDAAGNVFVTGTMESGDGYNQWLTMKFSSGLVFLASATYDLGVGGGDMAYDLSVSSLGEVYVAGTSYNLGMNRMQFITMKYSNDLTAPVSQVFAPADTVDSYAKSVAVTDSYVYVSGWGYQSQMAYVVKYDPSLSFISSTAFSAGGAPPVTDGVSVKIAADRSGNNVYAAGYYNNGSDADYLVYRFNPYLVALSSAAFDGGSNDVPYDLAVDTMGDVFVTGVSTGSTTDFLTLRYSPGLIYKSSSVYDSGNQDLGAGAAVWGGYVYLAGYSNNGLDNDFHTVRQAPESGSALPTGCAYGLNVAQQGVRDYSSIQAAVEALDHSLSADACVVIRDTETYSEQVTVEGFNNNGHRLVIMGDPAFVSSAPVVDPSGTAAFTIKNDSVTVHGIRIIPAQGVSYGIYVSSDYVRISSVTIKDDAGWISLAGLSLSSNGSVSGSAVAVQGVDALTLGSNNTVVSSTFTNNASSSYPLDLSGGGDSNGFSQIYFSNPGGYSVYLNGSSSNTFSQSWIGSGNSSGGSLYLLNSAFNQITQSRMNNSSGYAAQISGNSNNNTISQSTITANMSGGSNGAALMIDRNAADPYLNTVVQSYIANMAGPAVVFQAGAHDNLISFSTMTSGDSDYYAVFFDRVSTNTVSNSYIQGASGIDINGSTGAAVSYSVLVATGESGNALGMGGASMNLAVSSCVLAGGAHGSGIYLSAYNSGVIGLSSSTISGGQHGVNIAAQAPGAELSIDSITFSALTSGATAINFQGGVFVATFSYVDFADGGISVNVNAAALWSGSSVAVYAAAGAASGPAYENDPGNYVNWSPDVYPPAAVTDLSVKVVSSADVELSWTAPGNDGAAGILDNSAFAIQYSTDAAVSWSTSAAQVGISTTAVSPGTTRYYTLGGLMANTTYYFRLWTRDAAENYSFSSNDAAAAALANQVSDSQIAAVFISSVTLAWTPLPVEPSSATCEGYRVEASTDLSFTAGLHSSSTLSALLPALTVEGLLANTTYFFRAASLNWSGGTNFSASFSSSTYAAVPSSAAVDFTAISSGSLVLQWGASGNGPGTSYNVEGSSDNFAGIAVSTWTGALAFGAGSLSANTVYSFRVRALGNNGDITDFFVLGSTVVTLPAPPALDGYTLWASSAQVLWSANGNAAGSRYLCELSTDNFATVLLSSDTAGLSALFATGLRPDAVHYLRVQTLGNGGQTGSGHVYASSRTLANVPPWLGAWTVGPNNAGIGWETGGNWGNYAVSPWSASSNMPALRYGHAMAVIGDRVFFAGGTDGTNYKADVWSARIYPDGTLGSWEQTLSMPAARYGHAMAALKGRLYVLGGYNGSAPQLTVWSAAVSSYGTVGQWETSVPLPQQRYGLASTVGPDTIYVSGGYSGGARSEVWYAKASDDGSLGAWTAAAPLPEGIYFHSLFFAGTGRLYVSGGYDGVSPRPEVWSAEVNGDGSTGAWAAAAALPAALYGHAMTETGGSLLVSGGTDGSYAQDGVWKSRINDDGSLSAWTAEVSLPVPTQLHSMLNGGGRLMIFGGSDGNAAVDDIWLSTVSGTEYFAQRASDPGFTSGLTDTGWQTDRWHDFGGLVPNTAYHFRVKARNSDGQETGYSAAFSTVTSAAQPSSAPLSGVGMTSLQANWDTRDNPEGTRYEVKLSSDPEHTQPAASSDTAAAFAVFDGLGDNFMYYARVRAYNSGGAYTAYTDLGSTMTKTDPSLDFSSPTISVNQAGDNIWRSANLGAYNVDFADTGGSYLDKLQVRASTVPGGTGPFSPDWTDIAAGINLSSYTADWALAGENWALLSPGTNYVSVRAVDNAGNSTETVDAFYILKDTTPPSIIDNQPGENTWRMDDPGAVYDVDFADTGSGLKAIEYSASSVQNSADGGVIGWTSIIQLAAGTTAYAENWAVAFAALANLSTNYVSVRAVDAAGSTSSISGIDVFKVLKFVSGPVAAITAPYSAYSSSLPVISGVSSDALSHPLAGTEVTIKDMSAGYWNGSDFLGASPQWFAASGAAAWSYDAAIPWADGGSYQLVARSSDTSGNYSAAYSTAVFTFDASAPSAAVLAPVSGSIVSSLTAVSGTASDAISGVAGLTLAVQRLDDNKWWNFQANVWGSALSTAAAGGTDDWTYAPGALLKANLASGASYYVAVSAVDNSVPANEFAFGAAGSTFTFLDVTPPLAVTELSASTGPVPGSIIFNWTFTGDDGADGTMLTGGYKIQYADEPLFNSATEITVSTASISAGSQGSYTLTGLVPALVYYLRVSLGDDAGNWSELSNGATSQARPYPESRIEGHVMTVSSAGITGVLVEAFDVDGTLRGSGYTASDGLGGYSLAGIVSGNYTVRAAWSSNDITSAVSLDGIASGSVNVDFMLSVAYELASISGQVEGLGGQKPEARSRKSEVRNQNASSVYVELYQGGRKIATADVDAAGRYKISSLLPGKYTVKIVGPVQGPKEVAVQLAEGQNLVITPQGTLLKKDKVYAFPNPAANSVTFHLESDIPAGSLKKRVAIFGIDGRVISESSDTGWSSPGSGIYEFTWTIGGKVASGVYLYEVKVKDESTGSAAKAVKKLAIVK